MNIELYKRLVIIPGLVPQQSASEIRIDLKSTSVVTYYSVQPDVNLPQNLLNMRDPQNPMLTARS